MTTTPDGVGADVAVHAAERGGAGGDLLFVNAAQVVTCAGPARARSGAEMRDAGVHEGWCVAVRGDTIAAVGPQPEIERAVAGATRVDCRGCIVTPGLVDSHTHAVFGAPRAGEHEMRAAGVGYMEIARRGGGIHASVRDARERSEDELFALARARLARLASYGSTTVEVKSGYGLTVESELKLLRVVQRLAEEGSGPRLVATWLGAHEVPEEYRGSAASRASYVKVLTAEMLPAVVQQQLATFADVFCEPGVFSTDESRTILRAARAAGLRLKLHADELEPAGGAELAAQLGATSADHLAAISDSGIRALAQSRTVATLLPGTMLFLGRTRHAPARALIEAGVPVALATDFNPGTSPTVNFPLILTLGVSQLHLSAAEVLIAATVNGAAALDLADRVGQLTPGFSADLAVFEGHDYRELPYWYGDRRCKGTWVRGKACHPSDLPVL
ncbi:MAG TPA: imidazolonepropionase [Gemmatimonadaceae bacterium]|nr:imidazolonepropionase [Gemmatimonadaceae bacterium]